MTAKDLFMAMGFEQEPRQFSRRHQLRGFTASLHAGVDNSSPAAPTIARGRYSQLITSAQNSAIKPLHAVEVIITAANQGKLSNTLPRAHVDFVDMPNPRNDERDAARRAGETQNSTEDPAKFEAMIVSMIRSQVSDPAAQDQAIALALNAAGHVRSIAELEQIVAAIKQTDAAAMLDAASAGGDHNGHYRDDGTWVEERGSSGFGYSNDGDYMASSHNIFYSANGQLKSYQDGWNSWANTYGKGYFAGTQAKSGDVYYAAYKSNEYYADDSSRRRAFTALLGSAKIAGAEYRPGDTMTAEEAKQCIDKVPNEKLQLLKKDESVLKGIVDDCRKDGEQKRHMTAGQDAKGEAVQKKGANDLDEALTASKPVAPGTTPSRLNPSLKL
ncbi:hypothetical protein [Hyphomicrobium sp.]|uniref:hypothetical protein n=1 Tax=Hyphomicrobium sp. TaxID=82 RepID=UPI0035615C2E